MTLGPFVLVLVLGGGTGAARDRPVGRLELAYAEHGLHLVSVGGAHRRLTRAAQRAHASPSWSPDGRLLAFVGRDRDRPALFVMRADGTGLRRLVRGRARIGYDAVTLSRAA